VYGVNDVMCSVPSGASKALLNTHTSDRWSHFLISAVTCSVKKKTHVIACRVVVYVLLTSYGVCRCWCHVWYIEWNIESDI